MEKVIVFKNGDRLIVSYDELTLIHNEISRLKEDNLPMTDPHFLTITETKEEKITILKVINIPQICNVH